MKGSLSPSCGTQSELIDFYRDINLPMRSPDPADIMMVTPSSLSSLAPYCSPIVITTQRSPFPHSSFPPLALAGTPPTCRSTQKRSKFVTVR
ncbi:hypothetical protein BV25DRAFT_1052530 [Artomyces pyxidatus]|uniref:Uncharacterized protein n=1 Tax=Artomyces pyxidatus TaxID=48021 RepID=A0ACB8SUR8_9AGAM|nr:hypothetical protein BV25DRAFT_1052530 [Artomyces pyxidatus]